MTNALTPFELPQSKIMFSPRDLGLGIVFHGDDYNVNIYSWVNMEHFVIRCFYVYTNTFDAATEKQAM